MNRNFYPLLTKSVKTVTLFLTVILFTGLVSKAQPYIFIGAPVL